MSSSIVRYFLLLAVYAFSVSLLATAAAAYFPSLFTGDFLMGTGIYFFLLTALFHVGLVRASAGRPAVFVRYYMGATTFKLFIHVGVLAVFAFLHKEEVFRFALTFLLHYLFFTGFEVTVAYRQSSR